MQLVKKYVEKDQQAVSHTTKDIPTVFLFILPLMVFVVTIQNVSVHIPFICLHRI
jgi:hypothetical protein